MGYTMTSDVSRLVVEGQKEIFTKNFDPFPIEYPDFVTMKKSTKQTETYDTVGNLGSASVKPEGDAISYGKIRQAYQTSITNRTIANGFEVTMEAVKYDLYNVVNSAKAKELARTMREKEETEAIAEWDNAFTTNLADGVPLFTNSRPCIDAIGTLNDTLATASSLTIPENHKTMIKMFSNFVNHAGGRIKAYPNKGMTHVQNMMDIEEIYMSSNKANEISNTKNSLPKIKWVYSTYLNDTNAWFMWDDKFENVLFQNYMDTVFDSDEDKISTKNMYLNAVAIYRCGTLPAIGAIGNQGA
jgi:hypothetical protein